MIEEARIHEFPGSKKKEFTSFKMPPKGRPRKHRCKHCNKTFPSGVSLGGHMRCHMHTKLPRSTPSPPGAAVAVYGLREKHTRTWRLSDSEEEPSPPSDTQCRLCAKVFASCKALWGHMRAHSEQKRLQEQEAPLSNGDGEDVIVTSPVKRKWSRWASLGSVITPAIPKCDTEEVEAALTLMMLSRDKCCSGALRPVGEDSGKNSAPLGSHGDGEEDGNSVSDVRKMEVAVNASDHGLIGDVEFKKPRTANSDEEKKCVNLSVADVFGHQASDGGFGKALEKRDRFECVTCNKAFPSYQALGGHQTSHERFMDSAAPRANGSENNGMETDASASGTVKTELVCQEMCFKPVKGKNHECQLCGKVFASGQALGGHKRCHYVPSCNSARDADFRYISAPKAAA